MSDEKPKLTNKQRVFIDEYLRCFNASEAARRAGYKSKANVIGSQLLANPSIKADIQERLAEVHMSADEALKLTADIARGDITEFLTSIGNLDIDKLITSGKGRLVKKIKQRTITKIGKTDKDEDTEILETELELYPADAAQDRILRIHGKYKDPGTGENPFTFVVRKIGVDMDKI